MTRLCRHGLTDSALGRGLGGKRILIFIYDLGKLGRRASLAIVQTGSQSALKCPARLALNVGGDGKVSRVRCRLLVRGGFLCTNIAYISTTSCDSNGATDLGCCDLLRYGIELWDAQVRQEPRRLPVMSIKLPVLTARVPLWDRKWGFGSRCARVLQHCCDDAVDESTKPAPPTPSTCSNLNISRILTRRIPGTSAAAAQAHPSIPLWIVVEFSRRGVDMGSQRWSVVVRTSDYEREPLINFT